MKNDVVLLEAKTKEQREYIEDVFAKHMKRNNEQCCFVSANVYSNYNDCVEISLICEDCDSQISFDIPFSVMSKVVDYLRNSNQTEYWKRWEEHNKEQNA